MKKQKSIENIKNVKEQLKEIDYKIWTFFEQKIKEKDQRIKELEQENKELKAINYDSVRKSVYNLLQKCADAFYEEKEKLKEENTKLQEQLKNAILPKFKIGDKIYHIRNWNGEILKAKVKSISVCINEYNTNFEYGLSDWFECEKDKRYCNFVSSVADEEFVFATKEEAKQHLEERN